MPAVPISACVTEPPLATCDLPSSKQGTLAFDQARATLGQSPCAAPDSVAVAKLEHDIQLSTQLMVGVGVIFTAIGMRGALVHALSDPTAAATEGAFGILQRLVDGGILISAKSGDIRVEIFRRFPDRFEILLLFVDDEEHRAGIETLREMGLSKRGGLKRKGA